MFPSVPTTKPGERRVKASPPLFPQVDAREHYLDRSLLTTSQGGSREGSFSSLSPHIRALKRHNSFGTITKRETGDFDIFTTLSPHKLRHLSMPGDGACMFRAVSHILFGTSIHHQSVRENAVREIISRRIEFLPFIRGEYGYDITIGRKGSSLINPSQKHGEGTLNYKEFRITTRNKSSSTQTSKRPCHGNHYDCVYKEKELQLLADCQSIVSRVVENIFNENSNLQPLPSKPIYQNYEYRNWKTKELAQKIHDSEVAAQLQYQFQDHSPSYFPHSPREQQECDDFETARRLQEKEDEAYARRQDERQRMHSSTSSPGYRDFSLIPSSKLYSKEKPSRVKAKHSHSNDLELLPEETKKQNTAGQKLRNWLRKSKK